MPKQIQATVNFEFLIEEYEKGTKGCLLLGGTRSGKTYSAVQFIFWYCLTNTGKRIAVCRDTLTNLKRTTLEDFKSVAYGFNDVEAIYPKLKINKSDLFCEINGNRIEFIGLKDDPMRVYGLPTDLFYINEAVSTYKFTFNQLEQRCREFWILDCNPSEYKSWVYDLNRRDDVRELKTTYKDNLFLPQTIIKSIEGYEPTPENIEKGTADQRMWNIYGLGIRTALEGLIFDSFDTFAIKPDEYDLRVFGLDFGYSNDPTAFVEVLISGHNLYVTELLYKTGLVNSDIHAEISGYLQDDDIIVCDSAEPKSIMELKILGLNALSAKKGRDSINWGINKIKEYKVHLNVQSVNLIDEFESYKWATDRTGEQKTVPEDKNNHLIDALRYALSIYNI